MRWLSLLILTCSLLVVACAPDVIEHGKEKGTTEVVTKDAGTVDGASNPDTTTAPSCNNDCDCVAAKYGVCDNGTCNNQLKRKNNCLSCDDANCKAGTPCINKSNQVGTCPAKPITCKDDCDCAAGGKGVCENNQCTTLVNRPNTCLKCADPKCKDGQKCIDANGKAGVCKAKSIPCKHDCDCTFAKHGVCDGTVCAFLRRKSNCLACGNSLCKEGEPCIDTGHKLGVCKAPPMKCNNDCDCAAGSKGVCENNQCTTLVNRPNTCLNCGDPKCKPGEACLNKGNQVGVCQTQAIKCKDDCDCLISKAGSCLKGVCRHMSRSNQCPACGNGCQAPSRCIDYRTRSIKTCQDIQCQHDCDCEPHGLVCDGSLGACRALRRQSLCLSCLDKACKPGEPCRQAKGGYGVCGGSSTFVCGTKSCSSNQYCSTLTGGAPPQPTCMPKCSSDCRDMGACPGGSRMCQCPKKPSYSCGTLPPSCSSCKCMPNNSACSCQMKQGHVFWNCWAP